MKYLNTVIEQDYRAIRGRWRAARCFGSFRTAEWKLEGIEAMHMMRKGVWLRGYTREMRRAGEVYRKPFGIAA
jgi:IS6 family transposase